MHAWSISTQPPVGVDSVDKFLAGSVKEVRRHGGHVFIGLFSNVHCYWCRIVQPQFEALAREYTGRVSIGVVDCGDPGKGGLCSSYEDILINQVMLDTFYKRRLGTPALAIVRANNCSSYGSRSTGAAAKQRRCLAKSIVEYLGPKTRDDMRAFVYLHTGEMPDEPIATWWLLVFSVYHGAIWFTGL